MSGLIGKKLGMVSIFTEKGEQVAGTVIEAGPCVVTAIRTLEHDGYEAIQLGFGEVTEKHLTKPVIGQYKKIGVENKRVMREFRGKEEAKVGETMTVGIFRVGEVLKIAGISKGRGFAGVIKRHKFHRPNQSHGTHESFRGGGSISAHSYPARVFPGRKFSGHMGDVRVTMPTATIVALDVERNLIVVRGPVPGAPGGIVELRKAGGDA